MAVNRKLRRQVKALPCLVCGKKPSDPCHVRTYKVTQSDHPANLIPLCRAHHTEQHRSWSEFLERHPRVRRELVRKGWQIINHPFSPLKLIFSHPEVP